MMNTTSSGLPGTELGDQFAGEVQEPPLVLVQVMTAAEAGNASSMPRHSKTAMPAQRRCLILSRMQGRTRGDASRLKFFGFNVVLGVDVFGCAGPLETLCLTGNSQSKALAMPGEGGVINY